MAKVSKSASRSIYIRSESPYQGSMTAWALRDFVKALDEHGVPDDATLSAEKHHNTLHFVGVSVRVTTEIPEATTQETVACRRGECTSCDLGSIHHPCQHHCHVDQAEEKP